MRVLALTLLAGLLAVTAPSAQALCAVDEEGGCSRLQHTLDLDVREDCPEGQPLCIVDLDGNLSQAPNDADWTLKLRNSGTSAITVELYAIGFFDDNGERTGDRVAAQKLLSLELAAGESVEGQVTVPANVSDVRVQALSAAATQAEVDAELQNYRIFMMQPGEADGEPQGNLDDSPPQDEAGKDAPAPAFALVVLALAGLALVAGFRRE